MTRLPLILLAYANDRDDRQRYLRNLPAEARRLRAALEVSIRAGHCELIERPNATLDEILNIFQDSRYRGRIAIFHYAGHADSYHLLFETAEGKPAPMQAEAFASFLAQDAGAALQLVFLNGCSTQQQTQALLDAGVSAVLATNQAIDDAAATGLAERFYTGLANGVGIGPCFGMAQSALQAGGGALVRGVKPVGASPLQNERPPWDLYVRAGAESVRAWSLPLAAKDHLFGLPALPLRDLPDTPFRHLQWYDEEHAELFFGRGQETRQLYTAVTSADSAPILLLYGQSGVGKSSLLAAGLLPRLEGRYVVRYVRRDPITGLQGSLAQALAIGQTESAAQAWHRVEKENGLPLLLILDQVEEAYTRQSAGGDGEMAALVNALQPLFAANTQRPQGKLLLGFRKEWLPDVLKLLKEGRIAYEELFLRRLEKEGVMEAVAGPACNPRLQQKYRLQLDSELPGRMADDLLEDAGAAVAPTLQILLTQMWKVAKDETYDEPAFTAELYTGLKRKGILLADFLDQQLVQMQSEQPQAIDSGLVLDLLHYHTTPLGTAEEHTLVDIEEVYVHQQPILPPLVKNLQERYLLADSAQNQPDKPPTTRLAHDALAPLVRDRFTRSDAPGQQARRIVENRAVDWRNGIKGVALDEKDLALVESGLAGMRVLDADEERLLSASRQQARIRKRNRLLIASTLAALVVILLLTWQFDTLRNSYLRRQVVQATEVVTVPNLELDNNLEVDKYEVRVSHYNLCVEAKRCDSVSFNTTDGMGADNDAPISNVSAFHAAAYCTWLGKRLPTAWEWSAIAAEVYPPMADEQPRYDPNRMNLDSAGALPVTALLVDSADKPVGLIGNVWEWTSTEVSAGEGNPGRRENRLWNGEDRESALYLLGGSFKTPARHHDLAILWTPAKSSQPGTDFGFRCVVAKQ